MVISLLAGFTNYKPQSLEDIGEDLTSERKNVLDFIDEIEKI
jgi:hypothetical protein